MKRSWAKGQAAIVNALKRNTAFATKHGNAFNKIKLKSGDTDAAEWLKFQAFTTAVVEDEKLRLKIKKGIARALEKGETKKQFLNSLPKVLNEFKSKLKTTFETNQALAFGAAQQAKLIEVSEDFPYWKYSAIHDAHTRPDHAALDGKIFESTDHRFYPPIGYNCRCTAIPLTAAQAGRTDQNQFMHPKQELKQPIASAEFVGNKQKNFVKWLEKRAETAEPETKALIEKAVERLIAGQTIGDKKIEDFDRFKKYLEKVQRNKMTMPGLESIDVAAINGYTDTEYFPLNKYLRGENVGDLSEYFGIYKNTLNTALDKMKSFSGIVWRGTSLNNTQMAEIVNSFENNKPIIHNFFTSSSHVKGSEFGGNVMYKIKSKTGKKIGKISEHLTENEVLFKTDTRFKITKVEKNGTDMYIEMEEI